MSSTVHTMTPCRLCGARILCTTERAVVGWIGSCVSAGAFRSLFRSYPKLQETLLFRPIVWSSYYAEEQSYVASIIERTRSVVGEREGETKKDVDKPNHEQDTRDGHMQQQPEKEEHLRSLAAVIESLSAATAATKTAETAVTDGRRATASRKTR